MWNRMTGRPFKVFTEEKKLENINEFRAEIANALSAEPVMEVTKGKTTRQTFSDTDMKIYQSVIEDLGIQPDTDQNVVDIAIEFQNRFQKLYTDIGNRNTDKVKAYAEERGLNWKDKATKDATPDQEPLPVKTSFALATDRVFEKFAAEVEQASPRGPKERQQMRDAANMARKILSDKLGIDINMADFQALMWYPEKQLLASMNVSTGMGSDNDYVDGAIAVAKDRGLTDADITEALPDSERGRLSPVRRDRDEPISGLTPTNQSAKANALEAGVFKRADSVGQDEGKSYSVVNGADGYKKLQNLINENPDGFTAYTDTFRSVLDANDFGALREAGEIEGAFVVAPVKTAEIIIGKELPLSLLQQYIGNAKNLSKTTGQRVYLGGWFNSDDGQYYLDNVLMSFNRQDALYIAQGSDQIAIFDLSRFEEVNTNEGIQQLKEAGTYSDNRADRFRRSLNTVGRVFEESRIQYSRRLEQDAETTAERVDELVAFTEEDFPFTDYLRGEQDAAARELSGLLDKLPTNDKSYSLIGRPLAKHLNPVAQRKSDKGEPLPKNPYLYGVTKARDGKFYGIILQDGQDVEGIDPEDRPVKGIGSFGLDHIMKRDHHNEIVDNSRWPNVQQAAYDMLRVWSNQNGESGAEIVDFPDGGMGNMDLRLEWAKPTHKSPKLIMSLKFARDARTGSGFYTIRTMYPDMKDKRSRSMVTFSPVASGSLPMRVQEAERGFMYSSSYNVLKKVIGLGGLISDQKAEDATMTFLTKLQDRMLPVGKMIDKLRADGVNITDSMDTYLKESIFHGVVADRINTANRTMYEPVAETIKRLNIDGRWDALLATGNFAKQTFEQKKSKKVTAVDAYLYALHAKERNEYIRNINPQMDKGSGMSDAEADSIISWANSLDAENRAVLEDVSRQVRNIVNDTNQIRIDGGLIPEDFDDGEPVYATEADMEADAEESSVSAPDFQNYVPLRGILDPLGEASEEGSFRGAGGQGFTVRGKEDYAMLGRTTYGVDILAGVFLQHQNSIVRAEKNAVANSFLDLIAANPEATAKIAEVADTRPMKRGIVHGTVRLVPDMNALNDPNILIAKRDGKDVYIRIFDDRIAQAMKGSTGNSPTTNNIVLKGMTNLNRWLSTINTSYNPEFIITNLFRDLQTAGVNINQYEKDRLTRDVMGNIKSSYKGLKETIRKGKTSDITKEDALRPDFDISTASDADVYRLFQLFGGQNSLNMMSGLQDQVNQINKVVGELSEAGAKGQVNKLKNSLVGRGAGSLLNAIEDYNTIAENLVRVATFKALAPKIGYEKAAFAARNVTVDFAKGGELKTLMNGMYLFYNASLQGTFAMLNAATRSPRVRKLWASVVVSGLILDQMNALFSDEDEDGELIYDKIPQHVLEHNIILPDVFNVTDRSFITIPMPYGLNMAFNAGRSMSRAQRGSYTAGEATANIIGVTLDTLNPLGGNIGYMIEGAAKGDADFTETLNVLMPTIADPAIEVARNVDFTGGPIVKEQSRFDPTPPPKSQLYWNSTNDTFKSIASTLNELTGGSELESGFIDFQPEIYEFWTNFFTGGAGMFAVRAKNFMTETVPTAMTDGLADEMVRSIPFGRKITYSVSEREDMGRFIDNRNQILKAQELLEAALKAGDASSVRDVRQRFPNELRIAGQVKALNNARNRLLRRIKQVEANPRMPDAQKEKIIDNMKEQLGEVVKRANILMNKVL